jgi:hypothetical protein
MISLVTLDRKIMAGHDGKPGIIVLSFFRPPTQRILMIYLSRFLQNSPCVTMIIGVPVPCGEYKNITPKSGLLSQGTSCAMHMLAWCWF